MKNGYEDKSQAPTYRAAGEMLRKLGKAFPEAIEKEFFNLAVKMENLATTMDEAKDGYGDG